MGWGLPYRSMGLGFALQIYGEGVCPMGLWGCPIDVWGWGLPYGLGSALQIYGAGVCPTDL